MTKARVSIGTGTPTGEPAVGPKGPYVTDDHDDEVAAAMERRSPDEADGRTPPKAHTARKRRLNPKGPSRP
jgi:hypothetical protein